MTPASMPIAAPTARMAKPVRTESMFGGSNRLTYQPVASRPSIADVPPSRHIPQKPRIREVPIVRKALSMDAPFNTQQPFFY